MCDVHVCFVFSVLVELRFCVESVFVRVGNIYIDIYCWCTTVVLIKVDIFESHHHSFISFVVLYCSVHLSRSYDRARSLHLVEEPEVCVAENPIRGSNNRSITSPKSIKQHVRPKEAVSV